MLQTYEINGFRIQINQYDTGYSCEVWRQGDLVQSRGGFRTEEDAKHFAQSVVDASGIQPLYGC